MTLTHHDTTENNQWSGRKAELLGSEKTSDHDIFPGLELAVGLKTNPTAQVVHDEGLVSLGDPQFPRETCVLDRRQRRGSGPAVVA